MTNKDAYKLIGERAEELAKNPKVQRKALAIARKDGKAAMINYIYLLAIATLFGAQ